MILIDLFDFNHWIASPQQTRLAMTTSSPIKRSAGKWATVPRAQ